MPLPGLAASKARAPFQIRNMASPLLAKRVPLLLRSPIVAAAICILWLEIGDISTLFQDTAGNTPVTADGDPVRRINDKSGFSNHAIMVGGATVPTFRFNGGFPYIEITTETAFLIARMELPGTGALTMGAAVNFSNNGLMYDWGQDAGGAQFIGALDRNSNASRMFGAWGSGSADAIAANTDVTLMGASSPGSASKAYVNNVNSLAGGNSTAIATTANFGLFSFPGGGFGMTGRFYGGDVFAGELNASELTNNHNYLRSLMPSTIINQLPLSAVGILLSSSSVLAVARGLISNVAAGAAETSTLSRRRGLISSMAIGASETSALSRLAVLAASSVSEAWSEISRLTRIRSLAASSVNALFSQISALTRIRSLAASAVNSIFSENAALSRLRGFVSAVALACSESAALSRLRGLIGAASEIWSESSALSRRRGVIASAQQSWSEAAALCRLRGIPAGAGQMAFAEISILARRRSFGASGQIVFSALAFMPSAATFISAAAMSFASSSGLAAKRGFVGATSASRSASSALSIAKRMSSSGQMLFAELSALIATRTISPTRIIHLGRERISDGWGFRHRMKF
jgi:hypothetical protein